MAEQYPSDSDLTGMCGTTLTPGVPVPDTDDDPFLAAANKFLWRLAKAMIAPASCEVYKDGDLTFGVRTGRYYNGATAVNYAGASAQALTDNQTNYIYLTAAGVLTVNTTGFPAPETTPNIPLATIVTSGGVYSADTHVTDYRARAMLGPLAGVSAADLQDGLPTVNISAGAEAADARTISLQVKDGGGNNLAEVCVVRVWVAATEYAAPSATDNTVAVATGTALETITAHAHYTIITDATGLAEFTLTIAGAATRYVMAEIDGRVCSSGELTWAA